MGRQFSSIQQADEAKVAKIHIDHEIDLDSEPTHSELHINNKKLAQEEEAKRLSLKQDKLKETKRLKALGEE